MEQMFLDAVRLGYLPIVRSLVEHGGQDPDARAPRVAAVGAYAPRGVDVNVQNGVALTLGAQLGNLPMVQYLVDTGARIHNNDDEALRYSAINGHLPIVRYLVSRGADIHAQQDYALRMSAVGGHLAVVQYLVQIGADIHANDDAALRNSAVNGHFDIVRCLVEAGANVHANDYHALRASAESDHVNIVRYLVEQGCDSMRVDYPLSAKCAQTLVDTWREEYSTQVKHVLVDYLAEHDTLNCLLYRTPLQARADQVVDVMRCVDRIPHVAFGSRDFNSYLLSFLYTANTVKDVAPYRFA